MSNDSKSIVEARRSLKAHIEFMEMILKHLNGTDKLLRGRAIWASYVLHRYFNDRFMTDLQDTIEKSAEPLVHGTVQ